MNIMEIIRVKTMGIKAKESVCKLLSSFMKEYAPLNSGYRINIFSHADLEGDFCVLISGQSEKDHPVTLAGRIIIEALREYGPINHSVWKECCPRPLI